MPTMSIADPLPETMFTLSRQDDVAVLSLTCPAIRERQASTLGRYLTSLCEQVQGRMILEVSGVGSFSCAWINELLSVTHQCRAFGGNLVLVGVHERDLRVLRTTGLMRHLSIAQSRQEAMGAFGKAPLTPWRLAVARLLDIPVAPMSKAA